MSHHTFQHYIFDANHSPKSQLNCQDNPENMLRQLQSQLQTHQNNNVSTVSNVPSDQLYAVSTIKNTLGSTTQKNKYPYFFITGPAGTGKSFIINLIIKDLKDKRSKYLLLAPTGVAAQNIGGQTIHSALRIRETLNGFQTLAPYDYEFFKSLQQIDTIIIDEISMVSAALFSFISDMFSIIKQQTIAFGGLNVIVVGDLAQLPPVTGLQVFKTSEWKLFYPLFLKEPQCQNDDFDGKPLSRCQFSLQNSFALTVHKTQGLTLPEVSLSLDN